MGLLAALALLAAGCGTEERKPSLLLLVAQGVRADHLSPYGYAKETTPVLESAAAEGALFERAYTSTPDSAAALGSLLTGRFPPEHGFLLNRALDARLVTLAEHLASKGYGTHLISSEARLTVETGLPAGFEGVEMVDPASEPPLDGGAAGVTMRALSWLREERDPERPFFLMLVYSSPTLPFNPPEPFRSGFTLPWMSKEVLDQASSLWLPFARRVNSGELELGPADRDVIGALYDAELAYVDDRIGELIAAMREEGILDGTLMVITSDRGEDLGENGRLSDLASLSEANLRVPLIIRQPGAVPAGSRPEGIVQDVDLVPTVCDLLGVPPPDGVSDLAASQAPVDGTSRRSSAVSVSVRQVAPRILDLSMSVRDERYRLRLDPDGPASLVDLGGEDPGEEILSASPAIAERLQARLSAWDRMLSTPPGSVQPEQAPAAGAGDAEGESP